MRIIPAIDIIEGKCVRLTKGDYDTKKIYNENPLEVAKSFEGAGIEYLHVVDLDGAKASHIINYKVLEKIATQTNMKVDFGGGLKSDEDLKIAFNSGANQITGGSIAVKNPDIFEGWISKYGSDKIILGADCNNEKIAISGWQEESDLEVIQFIKSYQSKGITDVICTDISKDGMLEGPSFELYQRILEQCNAFSTGSHDEKFHSLKLIASGGISKFDELPKLKEMGCEGVIIGKAIYENRISLKELEKFIINK
ncbi:1-(5-phosphoribosyl)-5-[(5-phosphoribosylamino)methylideneamino]imidazole-4-carboxamide isomerase [Winogradskyella psychrotolerans]|uniref:1-(5-phosphoribosyl)-5-[(5- phosphoribosylamino)methylideneamino]imidazole-4- carboxamide isomerase n=1 Tax=Winogradskyella psychrotolerans TaxID=1344585 RepID=UPI001C072223|nr:1-(5-phosphoribosyl)-5-[(5-phosphoribosylamino)methylideneamino]imidazole-4-carboxamide isomerase [Winogradskyella psychrotolerans]MBU2929056.1 1-(5-phosphoribosyl)-5-[(5-phosphoribosylamino)methylideneamino]imidazole-4-carboxamide isomerase [Winogradskyella psychrotolerans]